MATRVSLPICIVFLIIGQMVSAANLSLNCRFDTGYVLELSQISSANRIKDEYGNEEIRAIRTNLVQSPWARLQFRKSSPAVLSVIYGSTATYPAEGSFDVNLCERFDPSIGKVIHVGDFKYGGDPESGGGGLGTCDPYQLAPLMDLFEVQCQPWELVLRPVQYVFEERNGSAEFRLQLSVPGAKFIRLVFDWTNVKAWDDAHFEIQSLNGDFVQKIPNQGPYGAMTSNFTKGDTIVLVKKGFVSAWGFGIRGLEIIR